MGCNARCIKRPIWCDLKYGTAKWNSVLRCWCDMVRSDGVMWNVVRFGMSEMVFDVEWCNGNVLHSTSHHTLHNMSHQTTFPAQYTSYIIPHHSTFHIFQYHITHYMAWCGIVWCRIWCDAAFCSARCGMLCLIHPNVAVMWNKARCRICAMWCENVMSCNVRRRVKCGDAVMNDGVVHRNMVVYWCKVWNVVVEYWVMWNGWTPY